MRSILTLLLLSVFSSSLWAQRIDTLVGVTSFTEVWEWSNFRTRMCADNGTYIGVLPDTSSGGLGSAACANIENYQLYGLQNDATTDLSFDIAVPSCQQGTGIEVALYAEDQTAVTTCLDVLDGGATVQVSASGLTPNAHYVVWVDGINGATCTFTIDNFSGVEGDAPAPPTSFSYRQDYCWGDTLSIRAVGGDPADFYLWSSVRINGQSGRPFELEGINASSLGIFQLPPHTSNASAVGCDSFRIDLTTQNACGRTPVNLPYYIVLCTQGVDTIDVPYCGPDSIRVTYPFGSGQSYDPRLGLAPVPFPNPSTCGEATILRFQQLAGNNVVSTKDTSICDLPATVRGTTISWPGTHPVFLGNTAEGCDSTVIYRVTGIAQDTLVQDTICAGTQAYSEFYSTAATYLWTDGNGNPIGQTPDRRFNFINTPGTYTVMVTTPEGCTKSSSVVVLDRPQLDWVVTADSVTFYPGALADSLLFIWTYTDFQRTGEYYPLGNGVDSITVPITAIDRPVSQVAYELTGACGILRDSISSGRVVPRSSSLKPSTTSRLEVYPNPTSGQVFFSGLPEQSRVEVLDLRGVRVTDRILEGGQINLSALPKGLYFLRHQHAVSRVLLQ